MTPEFAFTIGSVVLNLAVTWGVMTTKLAWLRADLTALDKRIQYVERLFTHVPHNA